MHSDVDQVLRIAGAVLPHVASAGTSQGNVSASFTGQREGLSTPRSDFTDDRCGPSSVLVVDVETDGHAIGDGREHTTGAIQSRIGRD